MYSVNICLARKKYTLARISADASFRTQQPSFGVLPSANVNLCTHDE